MEEGHEIGFQVLRLDSIEWRSVFDEANKGCKIHPTERQAKQVLDQVLAERPGENWKIFKVYNLFVYGILKNGMGDETYIQGEIYDLGPYPGVLNAGCEDSDWVRGELHSVNELQLREFDRIEGVPTHYTRERVPVFNVDKVPLGFEVYVYQFANAEGLKRFGRRCGESWGRKER